MGHLPLVDSSAFSRGLIFILLLPTLIIASPTISNNKTAISNGYHTPFCYPRTRKSPTQPLNPDHCEKAVFRFHTSIPTGFTDPTFTRDPDRAKLPNYFLVPKQITYRECTVKVDLYQPKDATIDMATFAFQGNMVIETCNIEGAFSGGEIVMEGERLGQAINLSIESSEPQTIGQNPELTLDSSALIRRTSNEINKPYCYPRTSSSPKQLLTHHECLGAMNAFWISIQRTGTVFPVLTNNASKAAGLPDYFLTPKKDVYGNCLLTASLAPRIEEAVMSLAEIDSEGESVVDTCLGQGPVAYDGGEIIIEGYYPGQAILLSFMNLSAGSVGPSVGNGNVTEAFVLPVT